MLRLAPYLASSYLRNGWVRQRFQAQEMAAIAYPQRPTGALNQRMRDLFALGPHFTYGLLFKHAYAFGVEVTASTDRALAGLRRNMAAHGGDSHWIAVHVRQRGQSCRGAQAIGERSSALETCIATFAGAVRNLVMRRRAARSASATSCAVLFASDRRRTVDLFRPIATSLGCAFVHIPRPTSVDMGNGDDNGEDTGVTALRDLYLLSHAHDLVGSFGSTLTLTIQELIAARCATPLAGGETVEHENTGRAWPAASAPPSVTYCSTTVGACLPPLPLIFDGAANSAWWHLSLERWPYATIRMAALGGVCETKGQDKKKS